jgi:hypothetical protein
MILAHIAGVPFEEWLAPLAVTGGGMVYALRATKRPRLLRWRRRAPGSRNP